MVRKKYLFILLLAVVLFSENFGQDCLAEQTSQESAQIKSERRRQAKVYMDKAEKCGRKKYWDGVIKNFAKATEVDPEYADAWQALGYWLHVLKAKHMEAIASLSKAIELEPGHILALNERASIYEELKMYEKAIADYSTLMELNQSSFPIYKKAELCEKVGRKEEALKLYKEFIPRAMGEGLEQKIPKVGWVPTGNYFRVVKAKKKIIQLENDLGLKAW